MTKTISFASIPPARTPETAWEWARRCAWWPCLTGRNTLRRSSTSPNPPKPAPSSLRQWSSFQEIRAEASSGSVLVIFRRLAHGGLDAHHGNLAESFFKRGRLEPRSHPLNDFFLHLTLAPPVAIQADFQRHVEKDRVDLIAKAPGHFNPLPPLMDGQIGGVHVVPRHARDQAGAQQGAQGGKNQALIALLGDAVEQDGAQHVAGERRHAPALEPGGFPRSRKPNGQNHHAFGSARGPGRLGRGRPLLRRARRRHGRRFRLNFSFQPPLGGSLNVRLFNTRLFRLRARSGNLVSGNNRLGVKLVHHRLLLTNLDGRLRLVFGLLFFTALHALAHPIAHVSCVTHRCEPWQGGEPLLKCLTRL